MTHIEMKQFIQEVFTNVIEDMNATEKTYEKYFSKNYTQFVDGKQLNYTDFVSHMKSLKSVMKSAKITFKHIIVESDKVSTIHIVDGVKKNGSTIKAQVNALFQINDGKIILCDELTRLVEGEQSDQDLGSRQ